MPTIQDTLRQSWLFSAIGDENLDQIAQYCSTQTFHKGQYLFHERTPRDGLFVVQEGQVTLLHGIGQRPVNVATIGAGGILGERLLLSDPAHLLSAQAISEVTVIRIPKSAFDEIAKTDVKLYEALVLAATQRLSDRLQVGQRELEPGRSSSNTYRLVNALLGEREVPAEVLYGLQTLRAIENFPITRITTVPIAPLI